MNESYLYTLLYSTMLAARKTKRYGRDSVAFEVEWAPKIIRLAHALANRSYRVLHNYAFLVSVPKWREIFATDFETRTCDHLLVDSLSPYIERTLHPRTFNNRKGLGSSAAVDQVTQDILEVTNSYRLPCRVIKWDLKGFFPNAVCSVMVKMFENLIETYREEIAAEYCEEFPDFLKWLAMVLIECNPAQHCELRTPPEWWTNIAPEKSLFTKEPGIGVPIGRLTSQSGMGLYINDEVKWLNDECGIRTTVFMDDGVMVIPEHLHNYALSLIPELRERLRAKGVRMNDKKFYDQPWQHGYEFLGAHYHQNRVILNDKTFVRAMGAIREYNGLKKKYEKLDKFISTVNSYMGMLKTKNQLSRIYILRDAIAPVWWKYLYWSEKRKCVVSKPEHSYRARLQNKYKLKKYTS